MIDIQTKIHDKFAIEFKVGFSGRDDVKDERFDVNTWIFLPNGLDINKNTYSKERFYTDMKSNIRLITPVFTLKEMTEGEDAPFLHVKKALEEVIQKATPERLNEYEFQFKLFGSIFKSSIRNESVAVMNRAGDPLFYEHSMTYVADVREVLQRYRSLNEMIPADNADLASKFGFTDEFMSHQVEIRTMKIIKAAQNANPPRMQEGIDALTEMLTEEKEYKKARGYSYAIVGDPSGNRNLLQRHSQLKKYIESALFLRVDTMQDGRAVKQISFSLAAGLAMMISMLVTIPFQKYLGNYPELIFIILIIIYMLKDRIKELTRGLFAYQLKDKYYDNKTVVRIKKRPIGWLKEGMDFITDDKVPADVLKLRNRNKLEADNEVLQEKIILYRKRVEVNNAVLRNHYDYDFKGINDIIRYHISYLTKKMDNPESMIECLNEQGQVHAVKAERVYTLHFVMQFKWEDQVEYKTFSVVVNRNGIIEIASKA